ncbi:hypothetical protein M0802_002733 [Mischocyttarus mexicanus]|nr:hypothetical protein M0802_002733 [Mischocyttarus mexicanus]
MRRGLQLLFRGTTPETKQVAKGITIYIGMYIKVISIEKEETQVYSLQRLTQTGKRDVALVGNDRICGKAGIEER